MIINLPGDVFISIPSWAVCILFIIVMIVIAQAGLWLFNRSGLHKKLEQNNEVAGILFGVIALTYSLILAFVIVAVWDDYNDLNKAIKAETDKLNSILAHTGTLPDNIREIVGKSVYDYCGQVINQEWQMQEAKSDYPSAIPALRQKLLTTSPENKIQERIYNVVDDDLSAVSDLRRERLAHTHSQMPPLIWHILKAGTIILILFSYFFQVPSIRLKSLYLAFLVTSISMCMFLVYSLDHPFNGQDGVDNKPYHNVQQEIKTYMPVLTKKEIDSPALYTRKN